MRPARSQSPLDNPASPQEHCRVPDLRLQTVTKRFVGHEGGKIDAVQRVSLDVHDGELLAVVGPSASGKTTLLRLIAGLEIADEGRISIADMDVTRRPPQAREIAMVFQTLALYPHMTTARNIGLSLRLRGVNSDQIRRRTAEMADRLNIRDCLQRRPYELSGGQRQRVALARALIRKPVILLLDEPLSHLDGPLRRQLCRELNGLHREFKLTTLLVTHDLAEAEALGQRLALMNHGRIEQVGSPEELRAHPATTFVAEFLRPGLL